MGGGVLTHQKKLYLKVLFGVLAALSSAVDGKPVHAGAGKKPARKPAPAAAIKHPLDPLNSDEVTQALNVLRSAGKITPLSLFPYFVPNHPPHHELLAFQPTNHFPMQ